MLYGVRVCVCVFACRLLTESVLCALTTGSVPGH